MLEVWAVLSCTRIDLILCTLSTHLKVEVWISALVGAARGCIGSSSLTYRTFQRVPVCWFCSAWAPVALMPPSLCSHLLSTTQPRFTFLTLFLMFKSFSWPASHISCLAVYSWWVWVLLWQRFLRSSAWHPAQVDYSNLPCYPLLLFSVIVPAMKGAQRG